MRKFRTRHIKNATIATVRGLLAQEMEPEWFWTCSANVQKRVVDRLLLKGRKPSGEVLTLLRVDLKKPLPLSMFPEMEEALDELVRVPL